MGQRAVLASPRQRNLAGACLAHFLHDGYTDQLYALLPLWQAQLGLCYAGLAVVRALYYGTMGGLQLPANRFTAGIGPRAALALSTFIAAGGFAGLCVGLVVADIGASIQHPRASLLVTDSFGKNARVPLGIYNFSGDLGKSVFPAAIALLLTVAAWRPVVGLMALVGLAVALSLFWLVPRQSFVAHKEQIHAATTRTAQGFNLLLTIGALDTATRMGYLLFLPFLLHHKGGSETIVGVGLALLFIGARLVKPPVAGLGSAWACSGP